MNKELMLKELELREREIALKEKELELRMLEEEKEEQGTNKDLFTLFFLPDYWFARELRRFRKSQR